MPTRRVLIVGDEENVRQNLRDIIANRRATCDEELQDKSFTVDLMDVLPYPELIDTSREKLIEILDGYAGENTEWKGVPLPKYKFARSTRSHHIEISYDLVVSPAEVNTRVK